MDNGLCRRKDATEISRQHQNHITLSRHGSDSKPEAEGYFEHIQRFLTRIKRKQTNSYLSRRCLKTTKNGKYFFSFFIMNVVTKKVTHLHIWYKKTPMVSIFKLSFGDCFSQIASAS